MTYLFIVCLVHTLIFLSNAAPSTENQQNRVQFERNAKFVDEINAKSTTYKVCLYLIAFTQKFQAFHYPQFAHLTPEQLGQMAGGLIDPELRQSKGKNVDGSWSGSGIQLPLNFDVSRKWPKCKDTFETIHTQGLCGSCYAVSFWALRFKSGWRLPDFK
jgi:hypothetical protein